jgi:hypothetical protein
VLCELSGRSDIFARDTRTPHGLLAFGGGIDAGAKLHLALGTFDGRGDRPGAIAIACGYILERCAPQAPSRREKRYRFQNIRLPRTIRTEKNDRATADDEFGTRIRSEIRELKPSNARSRTWLRARHWLRFEWSRFFLSCVHTRIGIRT